MDSLKVTHTKVGQLTDFIFTLEFPGLVTQSNDKILLKFGELLGTDNTGKFFSVNSVSNENKVLAYINDQY